MKWHGKQGRYTLSIGTRMNGENFEETHDYQSKDQALRHFARLGLRISSTDETVRWNYVELWDNKTDSKMWFLSFGGGLEEGA